MPQYCSKVSSNREKFELFAVKWSQPSSQPLNKMMPGGRMKPQKRNKKRRLDDGHSEVPRSAKKFISEEKMASYLQGLHIASDSNYQQQRQIGVIRGSYPTQQELLHRRLQGDDGTDEAFCPPASESLMLHRSPGSSPDIRLNPPTPVGNNNGREAKLHPVSRWDVIIEDLSSEEDDVALEELCSQPTVYLSPEARETLNKTQLLPPSIIDELCSKPCMELIPWVPKEKIVQGSLLQSGPITYASPFMHAVIAQTHTTSSQVKLLLVKQLFIERTVYDEEPCLDGSFHQQEHCASINQEPVGEELYDYDDNMEL